MKKTERDNYHVEVYPKSNGYIGRYTNAEVKDRCETMIEQINRHVDGVNFAELAFDEVSVCSFCGSIWTEKEDNYNRGCCDKDEENNPEFLQNKVTT